MSQSISTAVTCSSQSSSESRNCKVFFEGGLRDIKLASLFSYKPWSGSKANICLPDAALAMKDAPG